MNGIIRIAVLIMLVLATVSWPAMAQQTTAGAGATAGTGEVKTFSLGGYSYRINTINQVDATRLQEMGVRTVSVPAGTMVHVASSTGAPVAVDTGQGPTNVIVFGPGGFAGAGTLTSAAADKSMPTYTFTGNAGQYYVITQRTDGIRDMVLASFD